MGLGEPLEALVFFWVLDSGRFPDQALYISLGLSVGSVPFWVLASGRCPDQAL